MNHVDLDGGLIACVQQDRAVGPTTEDTDFLLQVAEDLKIPIGCFHCKAGSETLSSLIYCRSCGKCFHNECWPEAENHVRSRWVTDPCQKHSPLGLHLWASVLHNAEIPQEVLLGQLEDDRHHKWIGVAPTEPGRPQKPELHVFPAFTHVFQSTGSSTSEVAAKRYPRLVSFFGDTGTGKSTIIKNLIQILKDPLQQVQNPTNVPVAGIKSQIENSTTSGIHLYADPNTDKCERPILFADCEGPGGSMPLANRPRANSGHESLRRGSELVQKILPSSARHFGHHNSLRSPRPRKISSMSLAWAERETGTWVNQVAALLYPRFLYVFSDVVCFVSRQIKGAEHDMARLIDWAKNAHDWTTNQTTKPALVYIINRENLAESEWYDMSKARERIMTKLRQSLCFETEKEVWKLRLKSIKTADELLHCYYSEIAVVAIPEFVASKKDCEAEELKTQYRQLYGAIDELSSKAADRRERTGLLFDSENFSRHSITILDELAKDVAAPLDLHKLTVLSQAHPTDFPSHVMNLLSRLCQDRRQVKKNFSERALIADISQYIAICAAGEAMRIGEGDSVLRNRRLAQTREDWEAILEDYAKSHCRCEDESQGQRCQNYKISHLKGHQYQFGAEIRLRDGDFKSSFLRPNAGLVQDFGRYLAEEADKLKGIQWRRRWVRHLNAAAAQAGLATIQSNRTCLTCFIRAPVHVLPCGHSICNPCAEDLASPSSTGCHILRLSGCPLQCDWARFTSHDWTIINKPKDAGVRILSLDGGGIRGIVELTLLRAIVDRIHDDFGVSLAIQDLFDIIVGTSTGGIIALGVFKMHWTMSEATQKFCSLAKEAFSHRKLLAPFMWMPYSRFIALLMCSHLYDSDSMENALQSAFGRYGRLLGGGERRTEAERSKVAVVAANDQERRPLLFANYNREWHDPGYQENNLRREEKPEYDLKIWEAARCTSAAPTYFAPYVHEKTNRSYIDGALERNNPVGLADAERKAIWPNSDENHRDMVLSIGTGYQTTFEGSPKVPDLVSEKLQSYQHRGILNTYATLRLVILNTTNCQKLWDDFKNSIARDQHGERDRAKCHRLNIPFGEGRKLSRKLPKLDEVDRIRELEDETRDILELRSKDVDIDVQRLVAAKIGIIARQLVATLFYLEISEIKQVVPDRFRCQGVLRCRLPATAKSSAEHLINKQPTLRLYSLGQIESHCTSLDALTWNRANISAPVQFNVPDPGELIRICISFDDGRNEEDISGYPRRLQESRGRRPQSVVAEMG